MVLNHDRSVLPIVVSMVFGISLGPALGESWKQQLEGSWCDAKYGCTRPDSTYTVVVDEKDRDINIAIKYRDTEIAIFDGALLLTGVKQKVRWPVKGVDDKHQRFEGAFETEKVSSPMTAPFEGMLTVGDNSQNKETIPLSEGILEITALEVDEQNQVYVNVKITGKKLRDSKALSTPPLDSGVVTGTFRSHLTRESWRFSGHYTPPPARCSGPRGKDRTRDQIENKNVAGRDYAEPRKVNPKDPVEAQALKLGQFARVVTAALKGDKKEITLDLPSLPILDQKCTVKGTADPHQLKLVKQDAVYRKGQEDVLPGQDSASPQRGDSTRPTAQRR